MLRSLSRFLKTSTYASRAPFFDMFKTKKIKSEVKPIE